MTPRDWEGSGSPSVGATYLTVPAIAIDHLGHGDPRVWQTVPCLPALQMILEARFILLLVNGMRRLFPTLHQNAIMALLDGSFLQCKKSPPSVLARIVWPVEASQGFPVEGHWKVLENPWTEVRRLDKYTE